MKLLVKVLFLVLAFAVATPLYSDAKEKDDKKTEEKAKKSPAAEADCPKCGEKVKIPKQKKNRKSKNRSKRKKKGFLKCRKCRHEFQLKKPGKVKPAPKKPAPKKDAPEDGMEE